MNRLKIIEAVHSGILRANKKYEAWSNGWWITDSGVEGFVVGHIAEAIIDAYKYDGSQVWITMETPFAHVRERAPGAETRGRPRKTEEGNPRVDLVLYNKGGNAIGVIEVKRFWYGKNGVYDMERLQDIVGRYGQANGGTLQFGLFATLLAANVNGQGKSLDAWQKSVESAAEGVLTRENWNRTKFHVGKIYQCPDKYQKPGENWRARPICMEIPAQRNRRRD